MTNRGLHLGCPVPHSEIHQKEVMKAVKNLPGRAESFVVSCIASGHNEILITDPLGEVLLAG